MTTARQDRDFAEKILEPSTLLDKAIAWIRSNLEPDDVFSDDRLFEWAENNGYVKADN